MKTRLVPIGIILLTSCARFHSQPISAEKTADSFQSRSISSPSLEAFLAANHVATNGPPWDLNALTFVAFYYHPALAETRAQWAAARAAEITAGARPNPSVSVTPGFDSGIPGNFSPWLVPLSFDVPVETAGKRGKRMAEAAHLAEAARWNLVGAVWQARSRVRTALLELYAARETESLLARQAAAQSNVVRLLQGQLAAGSVSSFEVTQASVALETTQLALQDAIGRRGQARVQLANALGLPLSALDEVRLSFEGLDQFPRELTQPEIQRQALLSRADVRGALAEYAASQSALQLEIANQYPDLHLGPGYAWNNGNAGDSEWSLGVGVTLPVLNHNQGPVAEAEAKRMQAAAHFVSVQAAAIGEIDSALAGYKAALEKTATAQALLDDLRKQFESVHAQEQAGEMAPLAVASAEAEFDTGAQNRLGALVNAQQALGQLEDAVQSPLTLPPESIRAAQTNSLSPPGSISP